MMEQPFLKSLLKIDAYPEPTNSVRLLQTHVSFLFITDKYVYKVKKPVDFGFLNFTTVDRRRFYCNEEVRLNRRLCPDIYLGVVEVRESTSGATFCATGTVIDYAVKMKRLPEELMLDRLLADGKVTTDHIREIARTIANFHNNAERGEAIAEYGSIANIRRNCEENFQQIEEFVNICLPKRYFSLIKKWVDTYLEVKAASFTSRAANGFVRDCDGDIHLENVCLTDHVCIFDCIEFNDRFRYTDTAADIAFFLMDLDYHGKRGFSDLFLDEYMAITDDRGVTRVLEFYKVYRAVVRGKVESLKLLDPNIADAEKRVARKKAGRYFRLAVGYIVRQKLSPGLIITCGLMGSGKSTIATALASELGIENVSSDGVRKELFTMGAHELAPDEYGTGIYTHACNEATYHELLTRSEKALREGRSMLVDATFRRKEDRKHFKVVAERYAAPFYIIYASCPDTLIKQRLDGRNRNPAELSDGRWDLFFQQKKEFEPPGEEEGKRISLDTSRRIRDNIDLILEVIGIDHGH
jgi:aminoglycoside phosphotransferase family enzyme/predicted kinase